MSKRELHNWLHHWQDEGDAAFLYGVLASKEPDPKKREIYQKLAGVEQRHTQMWAKLLGDHGHPVPAAGPAPTVNARVMAWLGRRFGPRYLLPLLLREEGREVKGYMDLHRASPAGDAKAVSLTLAKESAAHAETLAGLAGSKSEPWHRAESGGFLRNVVYGFNDGLTANFGLVAGVIGAAVQPHVIMISGVAGMIADALSMGASGYLAAKSEQEVYAHEIAMEKEEIRLMPEVEEEELALMYQVKGVDPRTARRMAEEVMRQDRRSALDAAQRGLGDGRGHGGRGPDPGGAILDLQHASRGVDVVRRVDVIPLRRRWGAQRLHRPRHRAQRNRHVRSRAGRRARRIRDGRLGGQGALSAPCARLTPRGSATDPARRSPSAPSFRPRTS